MALAARGINVSVGLRLGLALWLEVRAVLIVPGHLVGSGLRVLGGGGCGAGSGHLASLVIDGRIVPAADVWVWAVTGAHGNLFIRWCKVKVPHWWMKFSPDDLY
ncbi:hypothetical protein A2T76_24820 [Pseudomonas brenneri]|nr:hypothetical protein A2T76_24820 [Pseudomonas brenneri]